VSYHFRIWSQIYDGGNRTHFILIDDILCRVVVDIERLDVNLIAVLFLQFGQHRLEVVAWFAPWCVKFENLRASDTTCTTILSVQTQSGSNHLSAVSNTRSHQTWRKV